MPTRPVIGTSQMEVPLPSESPSLIKTTIASLNDSNGSQINKDAVQSHSVEGKNDPNPAIAVPILPKKVRWDRHTEKHGCLRKKDMTSEEVQSYWYSKSDDRKIFMGAKHTVRMIMKGHVFDDVKDCSRGLECKTMNESKKRVRTKKRAMAALKTEQELQRLEGVRNPERLAKAVSKYTKELSDLATEQGAVDEQDVQEYLNDARTRIQSYSTPSSE